MKLAAFSSDVTPPVGHPLCAGWYPAMSGVDDRLLCRGVVLFPGGEKPIVLCALDWAELSNGEHKLWRVALAAAAETSADRVSVHCVHAHDTPWPDGGAQAILDAEGLPELIMQRTWCENVRTSVAEAVRESVRKPVLVTEIRSGSAVVDRVASNRRILDGNGRIRGVRWTRCLDAGLRAEPEGVIDRELKSISFWNASRKLAVLHYYAVHPTSYDGTGRVTADFVGIARERLLQEEGVPHVYFTECAGNVTCGKYNEGSVADRTLFAERIYLAMKESELGADRHDPDCLHWRTAPVFLPPRGDQGDEEMLRVIRDPQAKAAAKSRAALMMTYRARRDDPILISALHFGPGLLVVHLPGEPFVEYQLWARELRPGARVAVAAYGDCGPGYIPLERSHREGGYEPADAFCSPDSEFLLREAIRRVVI